MAGWKHRLLSAFVVIAVAGTPAVDAACGWLCGPGADSADTDGAHQGHHGSTAAHCHDSVDTAATAIAATSAAACPLHRASFENTVMTLGGLRSDAGGFSIAPVSMLLPGGGPAHVVSLALLHTQSRPGPTSLAPLVLRL